MRGKLLNKDVNGCPLKKRLASILSQCLNSLLSLILMLMGWVIITAFVFDIFGYPRVLKDVLSTDSFLWVNRYHLLKQIFCFFWNSPRDMELPFLDLTEHLTLGISIEWHLSCQHLIEADSKGPNVTLLAIVSWENLWSNIVWSTCNIHLSFFLILDQSEPKINKLDLSKVTYHDILWLDVSMDDILRMTMKECLN